MKTLFFNLFFLVFSSVYLCATESLQSTPFFQASKSQPYHLSIGALMRNQGIRFQHRVDADESGMIERALPYIQQRLE